MNLLNKIPFVRSTRRNHALEHATMKGFSRTLWGVKDDGAFQSAWVRTLCRYAPWLITEAVLEARKRLQAGESQLAIHPGCGTNIASSSFLSGTAAFVFWWLWAVENSQSGGKFFLPHSLRHQSTFYPNLSVPPNAKRNYHRCRHWRARSKPWSPAKDEERLFPSNQHAGIMAETNKPSLYLLRGRRCQDQGSSVRVSSWAGWPQHGRIWIPCAWMEKHWASKRCKRMSWPFPFWRTDAWLFWKCPDNACRAGKDSLDKFLDLFAALPPSSALVFVVDDQVSKRRGERNWENQRLCLGDQMDRGER